MQINPEYLQKFIAESLLEDIGEGDHSSLACIPAEAKGVAKLLIKEDGILCGVDVAAKVFKYLEPECAITVHMKDGAQVKVGDIAFTLTAKVHTILSGERLALNCMQRMSGIATQTNHTQKKIAHTRCVVLDTRKTTPGIRQLEKYAVFCGGGKNHRMGLYDMIMLKDNHIDYAGGIEAGINRVRQYLNDKKLKLAIEVEARNLDEVKQILAVEPLVDRIMLDNFTPEDIRLALELIAGRAETEASGGITIENIVGYAETGVDFISVGALTHSVKGLDMSLKAQISEN